MAKILDLDFNNVDGNNGVGSNAPTPTTVIKNLVDNSNCTLMGFNYNNASGYAGNGIINSHNHLVFDGIDDYISRTFNHTIISMECWVSIQDYGITKTVGTIFSTLKHTSPSYGFTTGIHTHNSLTISYGNNSTANASIYVVGVDNSWLLNTIYHIIVQYNAMTNVFDVYKNGVYWTSSATIVNFYPNSDTIILGRWAKSYSGYYQNCKIYKVKAYDTILSQEEITANYTAGLSVYLPKTRVYTENTEGKFRQGTLGGVNTSNGVLDLLNTTPSFSRSGVACKRDFTQVATGVPRYENVDKIVGLSFDGVDDIIVADNSLISTSAGSAVTVEFDMFWTGVTNKAVVSFIGHCLAFVYGKLGFTTLNAGDHNYSDMDLANVWVRVHAVFYHANPSANKLYINGIQQNLTQIGTPINKSLTTTARIGCSLTDAVGHTWYFKGSLKNFKMYNRVLTDEEITQNYSTIYPVTSGLIAWYPLVGNALDYSGNSKDGSLNNFSTNPWIKLMSLNQLITNGDFHNSTTGWALELANHVSLTDKIETFIPTATNGRITKTVGVIAGHTYYIRAKVKASSSNVQLALTNLIDQDIRKNHTGSNNYEILSVMGTFATGNASAPIMVLDASTSGWAEISIDGNIGVVAFDVTEFANAGGTKEQMDALLAHSFPQYWDGLYTPKNGIFIEDYGVNLISTDYNAFTVGSSANIVPNTIETTAPDGSNNAVKVYQGNTLAAHTVYATNISGSPSSSTTYTMSVYAKKEQRRYLGMHIWLDSANNVVVIFDLQTGTTVTPNISWCTLRIQSVGDGWYRCSVTIVAGAGGQVGWTNYRICVLDDNRTFSYQGDGTTGFYLWGMQIEQKAWASSLILGTRNADVLSTTLADKINLFGEWTVEFWTKINKIKVADGTYGSMFYITFGADNIANQSSVSVTNWYAQSLRIRQYNNQVVTMSNTISLNAADQNSWIYCVLRYRDSTFYLDVYSAGQGRRTVSLASPLTYPVTNSIRIGSNAANSSAINEVIDDFRISNIYRTDAEICANYSSANPLPVDANTVYKLNFDDNLYRGTTGYKITPPIDISDTADRLSSSNISWVENIPTDCTLLLESSFDDGQNWDICTNGEGLLNIPEDLTGKTLKLKASMSAINTSETPSLSSMNVKFIIEGSEVSNGYIDALSHDSGITKETNKAINSYVDQFISSKQLERLAYIDTDGFIGKIQSYIEKNKQKEYINTAYTGNIEAEIEYLKEKYSNIVPYLREIYSDTLKYRQSDEAVSSFIGAIEASILTSRTKSGPKIKVETEIETYKNREEKDIFEYRPNLKYILDKVNTIDNVPDLDSLLPAKSYIQNMTSDVYSDILSVLKKLDELKEIFRKELKDTKVAYDGFYIDQNTKDMLSRVPGGNILIDNGYITFDLYENIKDNPLLYEFKEAWEDTNIGINGNIKAELYPYVEKLEEILINYKLYLDKTAFYEYNIDIGENNISKLRERELLDIEKFLVYNDELARAEDGQDTQGIISSKKNIDKMEQKLDYRVKATNISRDFLYGTIDMANDIAVTITGDYDKNQKEATNSMVNAINKDFSLSNPQLKAITYSSFKRYKDNVENSKKTYENITSSKVIKDTIDNAIESSRLYLDAAIGPMVDISYNNKSNNEYGYVHAMLTGIEYMTKQHEDSLLSLKNFSETELYVLRNEIGNIYSKNDIREIYKNI